MLLEVNELTSDEDLSAFLSSRIAAIKSEHQSTVDSKKNRIDFSGGTLLNYVPLES